MPLSDFYKILLGEGVTFLYTLAKFPKKSGFL